MIKAMAKGEYVREDGVCVEGVFYDHRYGECRGYISSTFTMRLYIKI